MPPDHETLDALKRLARDKGATRPERAAARAAAKRLEAKIGKRPRQGRRRAPRAGLPEPPVWRRRRIVADTLQGVLDRLSRLVDAAFPVLWPLHWVLMFLPILGMAGWGLAWLAGYHFDVDVVMYALIIKYGVLASIALLTLVSVAPMTLAIWWLRTPKEDRPRHMLLWLLEHGFAGVLLIGTPIVALGTENRVVERGWMGKETTTFASWVFVMVAAGPIAFLYWRWLFRCIECNAPWINKFAPWAPRVLAATLALGIGVPTAWAAYIYTLPAVWSGAN